MRLGEKPPRNAVPVCVEVTLLYGFEEPRMLCDDELKQQPIYQTVIRVPGGICSLNPWAQLKRITQ